MKNVKLEGYELEHLDDGYYSNKDLEVETHQDDGPLLVIEQVYKRPIVRWRASIMNGPWNENEAFIHYGTFEQCKKHLARALREEQHIYA